jgi:hypothetical protein
VNIEQIDLLSIKLVLRGLTQEDKRKQGWDLYKQLYLLQAGKNIGIHTLHDGEKVIFHGTTFDHAFYKSSNYTLYPKRKDVLDDERVERVRWIGHLIKGEIPSSSCWEVVSASGRPGTPNRVYVAQRESYLVWLEPRSNTDEVRWKFMSAFPAFPKYIKNKVLVGQCIWKYV